MSSNIGKKLDDWLLKQKPELFPGSGKTNYITQFESVTAHLDKHVHPEVEKGAAVNDPEGQMFLNNHGSEHVAAVIRRASEILNASRCEFSPYEAYLFLFAAHLHDTGNLFGREEHERGCREIMKQLGTRAGDDEFEKQFVTNIAAAHGGKTETGDKDTIGPLDPSGRLLGQPVRLQFLAALLRLADEIADDRSRASRFSLGAGAIPEESKLYHQYSQSLHSVTVTEREIKLDFELNEDVARARYLRKRRRVFLLDEIFARTLKMHIERMYCMRFLRAWIRIDEVRVNIEVFDSTYTRRLFSIPYRLVETGYPESPASGIHSICPELKNWNGSVLNQKLMPKRPQRKSTVKAKRTKKRPERKRRRRHARSH